VEPGSALLWCHHNREVVVMMAIHRGGQGEEDGDSLGQIDSRR
jgi:hypothetical protein